MQRCFEFWTRKKSHETCSFHLAWKECDSEKEKTIEPCSKSLYHYTGWSIGIPLLDYHNPQYVGYYNHQPTGVLNTAPISSWTVLNVFSKQIWQTETLRKMAWILLGAGGCDPGNRQCGTVPRHQEIEGADFKTGSQNKITEFKSRFNFKWEVSTVLIEISVNLRKVAGGLLIFVAPCSSWSLHRKPWQGLQR